MGYPYRGFGLVDFLSARAGGTVNVYSYILVAYLDFVVVFDLWHYFQGSERSMTAFIAVERRYSDQTVNALFSL